MNDLQLFEGAAPERKPNAHHVLAAVVDYCRATNRPLLRREKGQLARQAKELLEDGVAPDIVLRACVVALRRGEPHNTWRIAGDILSVEAGQHLTRREYEGEIQLAKEELRKQREVAAAAARGEEYDPDFIEKVLRGNRDAG